MKSSFRTIAATLACVGLLGTAAIPRTAAPGAPEANVTRATLANGLRIVVVRDPLAPVVSVYTNYLVGADETPAAFPGMAHAQEHMAFRGCEGVSGDQISALFAQLGGDGDADTQQNVTQYFASVPAANLDIALAVDAACMRNIDDADTEWNSERGAIEQEVAQDLSNPQYRATSRIEADLFAGTPYERDPLGTRESFDKTTGATLKDFYKTWYAPNNAVLVIAGDVDPQATVASVTRLFASIPARPLGIRRTVNLQPVKAETFTLDSDLPVTLVETGYRLPGTDDRDYAAARVLADVLSSQRGDLYALVPEGKALQAGFQFAGSFPKASFGIAYGVLPAGAGAGEFESTLAGVIANYVKAGVPDELVEAAKHAEIAAAEFDRNSIGELASTWSDAVASEGRTSPDEDVAAVAKVTVTDVDRAAKKYLDPTLAVTANLIPRPSGAPVAAKGFGGGETLTSPPTKPVTLPEFAREQLAEVSVAKSTLAPTDTTLPNGIRLIVQPETISDTVSVVGEIKHQDDLQTPAGKDGVDSILGGLFSYGTTSLDRLAFQKALDDIAAQESAGPSFSLQVLKSDFDRGVQLLADNELHPALPAGAFGVVRAQTAGELAGQMRSPGYLTQRAIAKALLPARDPALREATPISVGRVSLADVRSFYGNVYRPDMTTIVVIGDITPNDAKATISKYFGSWTASGPKPSVDLPRIAPSRPVAAVVPDTSRVQDQTALVETVPIERTNPDFYALELGDHVLDGGFYATRLYHDLRQVAGLVYDVNNQLSAGKTRSTYSVSFGSDPPNVSKARGLVARDLRAMQATDVSAAELAQAKAILLRQLPLAEASETSVAEELLSFAQRGLPLDEAHHAATIYASLGAAAVRSAFAKYIRPNDFVQVVQGPSPS